jgi:hypothetical protein
VAGRPGPTNRANTPVPGVIGPLLSSAIVRKVP